MPTYQSHCAPCEFSFEWQSPRMTLADPVCPKCQGPTQRGYYPIKSIWTKPLAAYGDPKSENFYQQQKAGGHWTLETDKETGKVSKTFIDTPQKQTDYCRRNNLQDPKDLPSNLSIAADGKSFEKANISEL